MCSTFAHHVLIVDDNDDIREALTVLLQVAGFAAASAWGVEDADRRLREGFRPCVVLLDLHMPTLDGWAFLDLLRAEPHLHDVGVVIVSGDLQQRERAQRAGYEFLGKPMEARAVVAAVGRHCRRHSSAIEL